MKLTFIEALQMVDELKMLLDMLNSPDARWDGVQDWLVAHPKWKAKVKRYTTIAPSEALADLRAYIKDNTGFTDPIINMAITPEIEAQARAAIVRLQVLYKERETMQARTQGYISDEWVIDTSPVPSAHKSINDYQQQLKAKKKRRKAQ